MNSERTPKKKRSSDLLTAHDEWVRHMYSPGYFINRISWANWGQWRWMGRHPKIAGVSIALPFGIALFAMSYLVISTTLDRHLSVWTFLLLLVSLIPLILIFIAGVVLFFKKPIPADVETESPPPPKEKHKKQPKRRKDYH
jgi:hypothetical protein